MGGGPRRKPVSADLEPDGSRFWRAPKPRGRFRRCSAAESRLPPCIVAVRRAQCRPLPVSRACRVGSPLRFLVWQAVRQPCCSSCEPARSPGWKIPLGSTSQTTGRSCFSLASRNCQPEACPVHRKPLGCFSKPLNSLCSAAPVPSRQTMTARCFPPEVSRLPSPLCRPPVSPAPPAQLPAGGPTEREEWKILGKY